MNKLFAGCFTALLLVGALLGCGKWDPQVTLTTITLTPANPSIPKGLTQQFTATGVYSDGTSQIITAAVTWSSATAAIASVNSVGLANGVNPGAVAITATLGTASGTTTLTVTAAVLNSITVSPALPGIPRGLTQAFTATGHYSDGTSQNLTASTVWTTSIQGVASLNGTGVANGLAIGSTLITATSGGISGSTTLTVTPAVLASITLTPGNPSLPKGLTQPFSATGTYSDGTSYLLGGAAWTSANPAVASLTGTGVATGLSLGSSLITATFGGLSASTTLTVTPATLASILVTPANPSIPASFGQQLLAMGNYSDGTAQAITTSVVWSSASTSVATLSGNGATGGLATGVTPGTALITATSGSISGSTTLTVTSAVLASITVSPALPSVPKGLTQPFVATGNFSDGSGQPLTGSVIWATSAPAVATLNASGLPSSGLASAVTPGTSIITATYGLLSGSTIMTVTPASLVSLQVTPANPLVAKDGTQQFIATGRYSDNSTQLLTTSAIWNSASPLVAVMNPNGLPSSGLASALSAGTALITATSGSVSGSTTLTVSPATLVSINVTPLNPNVAINGTQQFIATGVFSDTTTQILTSSVIWSSASLTVATMNPNGQLTSGLATGVAVGSSQITATLGLISGNTTLTVTNFSLISIQVTPVNPSVQVGSSLAFLAIGTYSDLNTQNLTATVNWTSGNSNAATMNLSGQPFSGHATGIAVGTSIITASQGLLSGNTLLTVTPAAAGGGAGQLGSAATYGIMATAAITNTGPTVINGDVSLAPGSSMGGFPPGIVNGVIHLNDTVAAQARADLLVAYNYYKTLPPGVTISGGANLGALYPTGMAPGTYTSGSSMLVSTPLTLDGGGNTNAIWVFQIGSSLTTTANVILVNGAQAGNVFWVSTLDGTVGVGTTFNGTLISGRDVTGKTGSVINGRILAGATLAGTIALDSNTINVP